MLVELPPDARGGSGGPIYLWTPFQTFRVAFRIREASGRVRYATLSQPTVDVPAYLLIISEDELAFVTAGEPLGEGTPVVAKPPEAPTPAAAIPPSATPVGWKTYSNAAYGITLQYPPDWQPKQGYEERYAGKDRFFQVSAMSGEGMTIDQATETSAYHKLRPYGSHPRIEGLQVRGQEAHMILPSDDQPAQEKGLAALFVLAPRPLYVSGANYRYLVLWADKDHIWAIAKTLRFMAAPTIPSPGGSRGQ